MEIFTSIYTTLSYLFVGLCFGAAAVRILFITPRINNKLDILMKELLRSEKDPDKSERLEKEIREADQTWINTTVGNIVWCILVIFFIGGGIILVLS